MITGLVGTVFDTDEPPFVSISAGVMLDGDEHCVNITGTQKRMKFLWRGRTDASTGD